MIETITGLEFALRLVYAVLMGASVGLERQWRQRMAGTRTNALVAAGAAAFVMCGVAMPTDPTARGRIVSYVVSGVGFLGAGVIFKDGTNVQGLNTAATIWCSAAIGALCGLGSQGLALILAGTVILTNMLLRPLAYRLHPVLPAVEPAETRYAIQLVCRIAVAAHIRGLLLQSIARLPLTLQSIQGGQDEGDTETHIRVELMSAGRRNESVEVLALRLSLEEDVSNLSWAIVETAME